MRSFIPTRATRFKTEKLQWNAEVTMTSVVEMGYWAGLSSESKRLLRLSSALIAVMVIAIIGTIWHMRQSALEMAKTQVDKLGVTISEQATRSIQATDMVMQAWRDRALASGVATPEAFKSYFSQQTVHSVLKWQSGELPQTRAITVVDADGTLVNSSGDWPVRSPINLSDRDYFKYMLAHNDPSMFVSRQDSEDGLDTPTIYLVRRVSSPIGKFLGLVVGVLDQDYFQNIYRLVSSDDTSVEMLRADGAVLASYPVVGSNYDTMPASRQWRDAGRRDGETFIMSGVLGRVPRLVSVHSLSNMPIIVQVGISYHQITRAWRGDTAFIVTGTVCALICFGLLLRALALQMRRLERSEQSLVTQNQALQVTQGRMQAQTKILSASQRSLAEKSAALEVTLETMDQGLITVTCDGDISIHNRRVVGMLGLPENWFSTRRTFPELVDHQKTQGEFDVPGQQLPLIVGSGLFPDQPHRYERLRPDGRLLEVQSIPFPKGGMVRTFTDITERRQSEEQLRFSARHDSLTKLVNRVVFHERLQQAMELADRTGQAVAVIFLDLDQFKQVNDTLGHASGDLLLAGVAAKLQSVVRDIDTIARMGGDEFALVQPLVDQPRNAELLATRLLDIVAQPFVIEGNEVSVGASIGISLYPAHGASVTELLRSADTALYRAKTAGRGRSLLFDTSMRDEQLNALQLEDDFGHALSAEELTLVYQPIVDAETRATVAYEALLRWTHPTRGAISPGEFIPMAERSGLILRLGLWALEVACREASSWRDSSIRLAVNLSPMQFRQTDFVMQVQGVLARTGLAPNRLSLEITEGLLLEGTPRVLGIMNDLRALGLRFSLDDFGTAHAGLSYLRRFPFDTIKIDQSFVQDAASCPDSRAIVTTILAMAEVLKLGVIAEGVETEEQFDVLRKLQCRQVQGYLTGRPALIN